MYVGHYVSSLALKKYDKNISLGWLFIGAQFVDILFFPFVVMGIERMNIVEGFTATNHLDLEYMPYTHSLLATAFWALLGYFVFANLLKMGHKSGIAMALAIASHWFVDLVVHTPDLPIWSDSSPKLGFGIWNYRELAFGLEALFLFGGLYIYIQAVKPTNKVGKYGMIGYAVFLLALHGSQVYGPPAASDKTTLAIVAVVTYLAFGGIAHWLDKKAMQKE
ncbi:MAG: hypothetical protein RIC80_16835 [Cyclobacteriaceae bacterium]